jgi:polyhydroxyalkanoate synthesis regulator phasin
MTQKFRKKPVVIHAVKWDGTNLKEVIDFTGKHELFHEWFKSWEEYENHVKSDGNLFKIFTLEGVMEASVGDYIIRGVKGEHYPCKPDIFMQTYDEATESPSVGDDVVKMAEKYADKYHNKNSKDSILVPISSIWDDYKMIFIDGANYRQPEIDELKKEVERLKGENDIHVSLAAGIEGAIVNITKERDALQARVRELDEQVGKLLDLCKRKY